MPEMDGFETTARIRDRERLSGGHLPIVAMTAHAMKEDCERCLNAGMDAYLSKPIEPKELFDTIEKVAPLSGKCHGDGFALLPIRERQDWELSRP